MADDVPRGGAHATMPQILDAARCAKASLPPLGAIDA
jgi:hypothetical protein